MAFHFPSNPLFLQTQAFKCILFLLPKENILIFLSTVRGFLRFWHTVCFLRPTLAHTHLLKTSQKCLCFPTSAFLQLPVQTHLCWDSPIPAIPPDLIMMAYTKNLGSLVESEELLISTCTASWTSGSDVSPATSRQAVPALTCYSEVLKLWPQGPCGRWEMSWYWWGVGRLSHSLLKSLVLPVMHSGSFPPIRVSVGWFFPCPT